MNIQSYRALSDGIQAWGDGESRTRNDKLRQAALKKQMEREAADTEIRGRALKLQEDELSFRNTDRDATREIQREQARRLLETAEWARDPSNPANQAHSAQAGFYRAQAGALERKPQSPLAAQLNGLDEYVDAVGASSNDYQTSMMSA